ncbi:ABC transporter permease [Candidatus Dependentiae bacterium]
MRRNSFESEGAREHAFAVSLPAVLWQVLFLYVPIIFMIYISFVKSFDLSIFKNLTLDNYKALLSYSYFKVIFRSVLLAFLNAFFGLLIAYPIAYFLALRVKKLKNILIFLLVLPFWTNFLVQAYAWFFILDHHGLLNTFLMKMGLISAPLHILNTHWAIYIVMLFCYLPFMVLPIYSSMAKIDKYVLEASSDLGATSWQTWWNITLPLSLSGIKTGFFLVLIPSFGEFVIPNLLGGGKVMYVGSLIYYFFLETKNVFLGSAFTCFSGFVLIVTAFIIYLIFRRLSRTD